MKSSSSQVLLPSMVLFSAASIWGLYWLPLRHVERLGLSGPWSVLAFNALPLFLLLPLALRRRQGICRAFRPLILIGLLAGAGWALYGLSLLYTSVIRATMLFYLTPIWSTLIAMAMLGEAVVWQRWAAIVMGLAGLALMLGFGFDSEPVSLGDGFGLASGIAWGFGATYIRRHQAVSAADSLSAQALGSTIVAVLCLWIVPLPDKVPPSADIWLAAAPLVFGVCVLAVIPAAYAIVWSAQRLSPGRVGILMMSEAVVAVISASLLTDETLTRKEWLGAATILGAAIVELTGGRFSRPREN